MSEEPKATPEVERNYQLEKAIGVLHLAESAVVNARYRLLGLRCSFTEEDLREARAEIRRLRGEEHD